MFLKKNKIFSFQDLKNILVFTKKNPHFGDLTPMRHPFSLIYWFLCSILRANIFYVWGSCAARSWAIVVNPCKAAHLVYIQVLSGVFSDLVNHQYFIWCIYVFQFSSGVYSSLVDYYFFYLVYIQVWSAINFLSGVYFNFYLVYFLWVALRVTVVAQW